MKPIQKWFDKYGESHQNTTNKLIHWICVPSIFFSILGLLASIPLPFLENKLPVYLLPYSHIGTLVVLAALVFYLRLSLPMSIGILLFTIICLQLIIWIRNSNWHLGWVSLTIFVVAWIGQFIGHKIEGKKPSFLDDIKFLLIGPAWLLGFIYKRLGIPY